MRLATSTCIHEKMYPDDLLFYPCTQSIEACVKAGYKVLDMNFASYSRYSLPMMHPGWEDWVKGLRDISLSYQLEYSQAHAHFYSWGDTSPSEQAWNEELIEKSIVGAGIMRAKWLVIHPGTVFDGTWYSRQRSLEKNIEHYKRYAELAAKQGVSIAIENMIESRLGRIFGSSTEELLELLDALNDPIFGICWDFGHGHINRIDQCEALRNVGDNLKALHVADNRGESDDHTAPYFGTIAWEPIMKTLKEIKYGGDFTYEIRNLTNGVPRGLQGQLIRFSYELGMSLLALAN